MKKLIFVFFTGIFLASCSKEDVTLPGAANQNVFFENANIEVKNLKASQALDNSVEVNFTTTYETNVQRIELMSSGNQNTFCTVEGVNTNGNSQSAKTYSLKDSKPKANTMYYMLRFEDNAGNWTYSNYCTVSVN